MKSTRATIVVADRRIRVYSGGLVEVSVSSKEMSSEKSKRRVYKALKSIPMEHLRIVPSEVLCFTPMFCKLNIHTLDLRGGKIQHLPDALQLMHLVDLDLSQNNFVVLPRLPETLINLNVANNKLLNLAGIERCHKLEQLVVEDNDIIDPPIEILDLPIKHFYDRGNPYYVCYPIQYARIRGQKAPRPSLDILAEYKTILLKHLLVNTLPLPIAEEISPHIGFHAHYGH